MKHRRLCAALVLFVGIGAWLAWQQRPVARLRRQVIALGALGADARLAASVLLRALRDDANDLRTRFEAVVALGTVGTGDPRVINLFAQDTNSLRLSDYGPLVGISLWRLQPTSPAIVDLVCQATNPPVELSGWSVWRAAEVLAEIGPSARAFKPWLQAMLTSQPSMTGPGGALGPYFPHQGR
jgi:hypothetical protein